MAFSPQGFINKHHRLRASDAKITQPEGEYQCTMFFSKGQRRGVLAVWQRKMEWTVYADPFFTAHVDWNDPDCTCLDHLGTPTTQLHVLSALTEAGFRLDKEVREED